MFVGPAALTGPAFLQPVWLLRKQSRNDRDRFGANLRSRKNSVEYEQIGKIGC
jgi:hypothetical protein